MSYYLGRLSHLADQVFPRPEHLPDQTGVQAPGQTNQFRFSIQPEASGFDETQVWKRGERTIFVYGRIDYTDVFGEPRHTEFRMMIPTDGVHADGGSFRECREGNSAT